MAAKYVKLASVILGLMVMTAMMVEMSEAAISCGNVVSALSPCTSYLQGKAPGPSGGCCSGVKSLVSKTAASRPDRVTACNCLKSQASALGSSLNTDNAAGLPGKCGISLGYSVSTSVNCNSIP